MSLIHRLGLAPKPGRRPRRTGLRLEGRLPGSPRPSLSPRQVALRAALFAGLAGLALVAFPNVSVYDGSGQVGDVWKGDDVVAPFDFSIRLPEPQIAARRDSVRRSEPSIVVENASALDSTLAALDRVDARLDSTFAAYTGWTSARAAPSEADLRATAAADSARYVALRARLPVAFSARQWALLLRSADDVEAGRERGAALDDRLLGEAARVARDLLARGVVDVPRDSLLAPSVLVRNLDPRVRTEEERGGRDVIAADEVPQAAETALADGGLRGDTLSVAVAFVAQALRPSLQYEATATARRREATVQAVLPTRGRVRQSTTIIRRGDIVTTDRFDQLRSL
ncbi:MAG TPA: hypothetical protein VF576_03580, partial [Rubricoccaceae bacterium]